MKAITGQYECVHRSGIGLDYFTSRIDRLTLRANGQFTFVVQGKSRISHAAGSLLSGQQVDANAPEDKREGRYSTQGDTISFFFDDGTQEAGQLAANGIQIGNNLFDKVSDSTILPPTHRMKSNMEDIARGVKIAGAIGGAAIKAVKSLQDTVQSAQGQGQQDAPVANNNPSAQGQSSGQQTSQSPTQAQGYKVSQNSPAATPHPYTATAGQDVETLFCDQCGAPVRPGKRFCNHCGARLP